MPTFPYKYDLFLSHAVEDKIGIANDLCRELRNKGLKVWYSGDNIPYTGKLTQTITEAMNSSQFGVVVFSPTYLARDWTMAECFHLWARDGKDKEPVVILPVYYHATAADVSERILLLGDRFSVNADRGLDFVVDKIYGFITKRTIEINTRRKTIASIALIALLGFYASFLYFKNIDDSQLPSTETINQLISTHMSEVEGKQQGTVFLFASTGAPGKFIDSIYTAYQRTSSHYRNEYEFKNGFDALITSRKNVNAALQLNAESLSPENNYGMDSATISYTPLADRKIVYSFTNLTPAIRTIEIINERPDFYTVRVAYENNIRWVEVTLQFPKSKADIKRHTMRIRGMKPIETYQIFRSGSHWKIREITGESSETNS